MREVRDRPRRPASGATTATRPPPALARCRRPRQGPRQGWKGQRLEDGLPVVTTTLEARRRPVRRRAVRLAPRRAARRPARGHPDGPPRADPARRDRGAGPDGRRAALPRARAGSPASPSRAAPRAAPRSGRTRRPGDAPGPPGEGLAWRRQGPSEGRRSGALIVATVDLPARGAAEVRLALPSPPVDRAGRAEAPRPRCRRGPRGRRSRFWSGWLERGARFEVPEEAVNRPLPRQPLARPPPPAPPRRPAGDAGRPARTRTSPTTRTAPPGRSTRRSTSTR